MSIGIRFLIHNPAGQHHACRFLHQLAVITVAVNGKMPRFLASSLAVRLRSSLYGAVRRMLIRFLSISKRSPPCPLSSVCWHSSGNLAAKAIDLPDIDSYIGLMHTFFALEDRYGLKISEIDGELCLRLDKSKGTEYQNMFELLYSWRQITTKLEAREITKEEYDQWRYKYPEFDFSKPNWEKVGISQGISDILLEGLKEG